MTSIEGGDKWPGSNKGYRPTIMAFFDSFAGTTRLALYLPLCHTQVIRIGRSHAGEKTYAEQD